MRQEIAHVFSSQGDGEWAERSDGQQQRVEAAKAARIAQIERTKYNSLRGALRSERRRAERKLAKSAYADVLAGSASKLTKKRRASVARYEAQAAELERVAAGGAKAEHGPKKLYERMGRREQRAAAKVDAVQRGQLLGRFANSISVSFDKKGWEMWSRIPWAGAHNEGATVGKGARLPARTFLTWTPKRLEKFVEMANDYLKSKAAGRGTR